MQAGNVIEISATCIMTPKSIAAYIQHEKNLGASENALRNYKRVTKDILLAWRQSLKDHGYSPDTELNYLVCLQVLMMLLQLGRQRSCG